MRLHPVPISLRELSRSSRPVVMQTLSLLLGAHCLDGCLVQIVEQTGAGSSPLLLPLLEHDDLVLAPLVRVAQVLEEGVLGAMAAVDELKEEDGEQLAHER